jgi:hypothetical protein
VLASEGDRQDYGEDEENGCDAKLHADSDLRFQEKSPSPSSTKYQGNQPEDCHYKKSTTEQSELKDGTRRVAEELREKRKIENENFWVRHIC